MDFPTKNTDSDSHPWMRASLRGPEPSREASVTIGAKRSKIGCIEDTESNSSTFLSSSFPEVSLLGVWAWRRRVLLVVYLVWEG